ncbi:hypothetical protein C1J01_20160 [Nonomuraea aridisoli]|uniref:Uncharacterized protein n=2 Tax=Nonomuraea aridisoli TaxID=2070368 RepID=A0A2W2F589_9ACTN|nr:hypothetical protein C1J01_20160 [Nonomuraea aridisoli]
MPDMIHEMVNDRIQTLHREAAEYRLVERVRRVQRARAQVQRARAKVKQAHDRLEALTRQS